MNRRAFLSLLGLAPVAAPTMAQAVMSAPLPSFGAALRINPAEAFGPGLIKDVELAAFDEAFLTGDGCPTIPLSVLATAPPFGDPALSNVLSAEVSSGPFLTNVDIDGGGLPPSCNHAEISMSSPRTWHLTGFGDLKPNRAQRLALDLINELSEARRITSAEVDFLAAGVLAVPDDKTLRDVRGLSRFSAPASVTLRSVR